MPRFSLPAFLSTVAVLAFVGACGGGDNLVLPNDGLAHDIAVVKGANQTAPVGALLPDSIVVRVTDARGRPVAGQNVAFAAAGGGSVAPDTVTTNADGRAGVRWTLGTTAGTQQLSATVVGAPTPLSVAVSATAGAGGLAGFTAVQGDNQTATAGTLLPDSLVVRATDANGNPVPGVAVAWTLTGGGTASATSTSTGPDGLTGILRTLGPTAGPQTTTATASSGTIVFHATATVGAAGRLTITTQPSATAQSSVPFAQQPRLQVRDANGNPVRQAGLAITASIASGPVGATLTGDPTVPTDANGLATFQNLGIGGSGGTYTLNFGGAGLSGVTSNGITVAAGAATHLTLVTQPSSTAQSGVVLAQQPVVQLLDASNNPAAQAGVPVTAAIASGGGTLGGTVTRSTGSDGRATFTDLSISGSAGTRTLVFFSGSLAAVTSGPIAVSAAPISASESGVSAAPTSFTAGSGSSTITVVARDASGVPVSGAAVTLSVSGSGNTVSTPAVTNANGATTATLQSTGAGVKTIAATINGVLVTQTATVTVVAGAPSSTGSTVTADPTSVAVGSASTITVTVMDANGNPISGAAVSLATTGGATVTQPAGPTGANGVVTGSLTSATGGDKTVTATVNGSIQLASQPTVTFVGLPPSASRSTVTADPTTIPASTGDLTSTVTVTVLDDNGAPVSGSTVTLTSSGTGNSIAPVSAVSNASGVATFTFSSTVAETKTLTATADGTTITQTATVTVTAASPSAQQSSANVPNGARNELTVFTVQLRDLFRNALTRSGGTVTASVTGKNQGAPVTVLDNSNGTYTGSYTPTAPGNGGTDYVNIFLEGTPIGGSPYISNL
jgi:adhesin/invasin